MTAMPMAQAAASCMTPEASPREMARKKVKRMTLSPALRATAYPSRLVSPAFSRAMAKIRQHMMNRTTGCMYEAQTDLTSVTPGQDQENAYHYCRYLQGYGLQNEQDDQEDQNTQKLDGFGREPIDVFDLDLVKPQVRGLFFQKSRGGFGRTGVFGFQEVAFVLFRGRRGQGEMTFDLGLERLAGIPPKPWNLVPSGRGNMAIVIPRAAAIIS